MTHDALAPLRQTDVMDPDRARALQATLGHVPDLGAGDALPPFFHQLYFWNLFTPDLLGRDGHPLKGQGVIPDLGLPRRMWAGGDMVFLAPILLGQSCTCTTTLVQADHKIGRTGPLGLVTLRLDFEQNGTLCLSETRNLIYREDPHPDAPAPSYPKAPERAEQETAIAFNTTTLFRYSALTFNGHRIHYDLDYATGVEGYSGLVVHGPLLAQHLMLFAEEALGPLRSFRFRATAPLMHSETATACRDGNHLWIRGQDGRQCMIAQVKF